MRDAVSVRHDNGNFYSFKNDGSFQINTNTDSAYLNIAPGTQEKASVVINQGELLTTPVLGAFEFDGDNFYLTTKSGRSIIGSGSGTQGPAGPAGPQGIQGPAGPIGSGIDLSNGGFLNGTVSFTAASFLEDARFTGTLQIPTGASNGYVLTSDANGFASWVNIAAVVNGSGTASSGVAGAIQFSDGSGGFDSNAAGLFWDNANNRLGLGNSSPVSKLDISLSAATENGLIVRSNSNQSANLINLYDNGGSLNTEFRPFGRFIINQKASEADNDLAGTSTIIRAKSNLVDRFTVFTNGVIYSYNSLGFQSPNTGINYGGYNLIFTGSGIAVNESGVNQDLRIEGDNNQNLFFVDASSDRIGISDPLPSALLDVGNGTANFIDGINDLLVADDAEIDGNLYVGSSVIVNNSTFDTPSSYSIGDNNNSGGQIIFSPGNINFRPSSLNSDRLQIDIQGVTVLGGVTGAQALLRVDRTDTTAETFPIATFYDSGSERMRLTRNGDLYVSGKINANFNGSTFQTNFSPGSVIFTDVAGNLNENGSRFFWDNNNGNLGIGTSTPSAKLELNTGILEQGQSAFSVVATMATDTNATTVYGSDTVINIPRGNSNTTSFASRINAATFFPGSDGNNRTVGGLLINLGDVGSGASPIGYGLKIENFGNNTGTSYGVYAESGFGSPSYGVVARGEGGPSSYGVYATSQNTGGIRNSYAGVFSIDGNVTGDAYGIRSIVENAPLITGNYYGLDVNIAGATAGNGYAAVFRGGNVGIGTTTPAYKLHVVGSSVAAYTAHTVADDFVVENNSDAGITIISSAVNEGFIALGTSAAPSEAFLRYTPAIDTFRIQTPTGTYFFNSQFTVPNGTAVAPVYSFINDPDTGIYAPNTNNNNIAFTTGGSEKMRLDTNGNLGIGMTSLGEKLAVNGDTLVRGGIQLDPSSAKPVCDSTTRGIFWYEAGGAGVKDNVEVCAKDAADAYAWRTIY